MDRRTGRLVGVRAWAYRAMDRWDRRRTGGGLIRDRLASAGAPARAPIPRGRAAAVDAGRVASLPWVARGQRASARPRRRLGRYGAGTRRGDAPCPTTCPTRRFIRPRPRTRRRRVCRPWICPRPGGTRRRSRSRRMATSRRLCPPRPCRPVGPRAGPRAAAAGRAPSTGSRRTEPRLHRCPGTGHRGDRRGHDRPSVGRPRRGPANEAADGGAPPAHPVPPWATRGGTYVR